MAKSQVQALQNNVLITLGIGLVLGFVVGHLYTRLNILQKGGDTVTAQKQQENTTDTTNPTQPEQKRDVSIKKPDAKVDHWRWNKDAQYVLVEYSDFECPFCGAFFPTTQKLEKEYGDEFGIVYRHFPLSFHPKAMPSAQASECVAELGGEDKFWAMHDEIFTRMPDLEITELADVAQELGLDKAAVQKCIDSGKYEDKVNGQLNEGTQAGIAATPTTVLYDMKTGKSTLIEGALPYDQVKKIIDDFIES
ncbi:hypothetical protein A3H80_01860 [Candidatus Roizmanbacteria bacterium RIFCSPLOWO2_02_FULL_37_19]|uniref:Thioredoxin domain-containing protein n=1 Tax=Candidatus Roizmanbacteria bacterium RIFCSPHIGHO2_02_FULL_37_24 TaxID=1802037 RepID=A0A1F7GWP9_9BACT|nr:MAG: hypothetical protein A2862_02510 [Candidatus Roizmanbacteria bacterium RIFCSPHIGHO2_01_FULL_38_41]OGK23520.1 MAG: hypothetical protein A3C24_01860 [Candidatus Roizmanbacteria bacterium RIFCSPHIGHO2_02_FULL_37_24]OGK31926.1 MAG: hypothetical protein A3E10_05330 [Candidatus Roizmanbacteria bacterium RIFCSPHIGHO2_12_FULL_37_23]OGK45410.1 MAG: hypothetical protein A2956_04795 [Candidatus Roizmanbacteria bacterium RIFCSPLOWO2_01_FULL_37_57]OGK54056.1 MAG: hypothetical protein A3H80_01860 [Ca